MVPLSKVEKKWVKLLSKAFPAYSHQRIVREAIKRAANRRDLSGYPSERPEDEEVVVTRRDIEEVEQELRDSMTLTEKATIGAGIWGLKRWFRREVMPELVKQPSLAPTRKVNGAGAGGVVAGLVTIIAVRAFGIELSATEALIVAGAISSAGAWLGGWVRREQAPVHVPE